VLRRAQQVRGSDPPVCCAHVRLMRGAGGPSGNQIAPIIDNLVGQYVRLSCLTGHCLSHVSAFLNDKTMDNESNERMAEIAALCLDQAMSGTAAATARSKTSSAVSICSWVTIKGGIQRTTLP
jgi:hypothetical protein